MTTPAEFEPRFTLKELVEASGVNDRNIRYYIEQNLLPPARGKGRSAYYTPVHLERLARVVAMRDQGLSIDEIRTAILQEAAPSGYAPETWERISLHPGLQLHMRSGAPEHVQSFAAEVQRLAAQWFDSSGEQDR